MNLEINIFSLTYSCVKWLHLTKFGGAKIMEDIMKWFTLFFLNRQFKELLDSLAKNTFWMHFDLKIFRKKDLTYLKSLNNFTAHASQITMLY